MYKYEDAGGMGLGVPAGIGVENVHRPDPSPAHSTYIGMYITTYIYTFMYKYTYIYISIYIYTYI